MRCVYGHFGCYLGFGISSRANQDSLRQCRMPEYTYFFIVPRAVSTTVIPRWYCDNQTEAINVMTMIFEAVPQCSAAVN